MDVIGYLVVTIFVLGVSYGLLLQTKHLLNMKKNKTNTKSSRLWLCSCLRCFSIAGFLISFLLNILVHLQLIHSYFITSNSTNIFCLVFLTAFIIAKYIITP